jgi:hypothetical protein
MAVSGDGRTSTLADQIFIVAHGGLDVCDGGHRSIVMKNPRGVRRCAHPHIRKQRECVGHPANILGQGPLPQRLKPSLKDKPVIAALKALRHPKSRRFLWPKDRPLISG